MRRFFLTAMMLPALALAAAAAEPEAKNPPPEMDSILASVNGVPVSLVDILGTTRDSEYRACAVFSGRRLEEEIRSIRRKAVDEKIDKLLVLEEYRKQENPPPIPVQAIEEELDKIAERMGVRSRSEFVRKLRNSGTDIDKLRKEIEEYIIYHMMVYDRIRIESNITPKEVYEYYQAHKKEFVRPETIELAMIMLKLDDPKLEERSAAIAKELASSPDAFAELARKYSSGPDSESGGNLGKIERKRLRAEFAAAMPVLEAGRVYGPVRTAEGVSFLRILAHTPEEKGDFRSLSPEIRRKIDQEQRETIRKAYMDKLRAQAIVRYFF